MITAICMCVCVYVYVESYECRSTMLREHIEQDRHDHRRKKNEEK